MSAQTFLDEVATDAARRVAGRSEATMDRDFLCDGVVTDVTLRLAWAMQRGEVVTGTDLERAVDGVRSFAAARRHELADDREALFHALVADRGLTARRDVAHGDAGMMPAQGTKVPI